MANQRTSRKTRSRTESRKPGGRPSQSHAKGSGPMARRDMKGLNARRDMKDLKARINLAKGLFDWASHPPVLPPQTSARTFNEMLADLCSKLAKISACGSMENAVEGITDHLVLYGDKMSQDEISNLEKQKGELIKGMGRFGC